MSNGQQIEWGFDSTEFLYLPLLLYGPSCSPGQRHFLDLQFFTRFNFPPHFFFGAHARPVPFHSLAYKIGRGLSLSLSLQGCSGRFLLPVCYRRCWQKEGKMVLPKLKKPKVEVVEKYETEAREEEKALIFLIDHRQKEVKTLEIMVTKYQSQLEDAKKRLRDSQFELDQVRSRSSSAVNSQTGGTRLLNPPTFHDAAAAPAPTQAVAGTSSMKIDHRPSTSPPGFPKIPKHQVTHSITPSGNNSGSKRKLGLLQKTAVTVHHCDLITGVRTRTSPDLINFGKPVYIPSTHNRKLRSLALNPVHGGELVTSSLDGTVKLWKLETQGSNISLHSTRGCASPKANRWPEVITWHPDGEKIFAAYSADGGDSQISIINFNLLQGRVNFLEEKPHDKGIINSIVFMPWEDKCFATGGSDHAIVLWTEKEGCWKSNAIHKAEHSSAVMGVAGLKQKSIIVSVGLDKKFLGFDLQAGNTQFKYKLDHKCMTVLPNPHDYNLLMVQTGCIWRQLQLFDIRSNQKEIHAFGFKQDCSEANSALIKPAWSPDGMYISSGSPGTKIHIFDIRYNAYNPAQSLQAHKKRILKAEWHRSNPLLISISSDLQIGIHDIT